MATRVEICNQALGILGVENNLSSLDEDSSSARAFRNSYSSIRAQLFDAYDWKFASAIVSLSLAAAPTEPPWGFRYAFPQACLRVREIQRKDAEDIVPYEESYSPIDGARTILTDKAEAVCRYTFLVENERLYPPLFRQALSYKLVLRVGFALIGDRMNQPLFGQLSDRALGEAANAEAVSYVQRGFNKTTEFSAFRPENWAESRF